MTTFLQILYMSTNLFCPLNINKDILASTLHANWFILSTEYNIKTFLQVLYIHFIYNWQVVNNDVLFVNYVSSMSISKAQFDFTQNIPFLLHDFSKLLFLRQLLYIIPILRGSISTMRCLHLTPKEAFFACVQGIN